MMESCIASYACAVGGAFLVWCALPCLLRMMQYDFVSFWMLYTQILTKYEDELYCIMRVRGWGCMFDAPSPVWYVWCGTVTSTFDIIYTNLYIWWRVIILQWYLQHLMFLTYDIWMNVFEQSFIHVLFVFDHFMYCMYDTGQKWLK